MSFLAPLFLLGAAAVALPVIFHLIRRTTREHTPFSSLMFLFPTPPRLTKRSRLEHFLLLALRCLVLCLLALGFARPFFKTEANLPPPSKARRLILLVDQSASMRRANLWSDARDRVRAIVRQTTPADQVAVLLFDRQLTPLVSFDQWNSAPASERAALIEAKLAQTGPGWASTRLDAALIQAAETMADAGGKSVGASGEIVLISDLQEGSRLERLQGYEWPRQVRLRVEALKLKHTSNASIQPVDEAPGGNPSTEGIRVRVSNTSDSKLEQFKVGWAAPDRPGFAGAPLDVYVPPGQSRVLSVPLIPGQPMLNRVLLHGDEDDFDNVAFTLPLEQTRLQVLYLGNDSAVDPKQPLYFLKRSLQETSRQVVELHAPPLTAPLATADIHSASLIVVTDPLSEESAQALRAQVLAGKTCLCLAKNESISGTLAKLVGVGQFPTSEARLMKYAMLGEIDFRNSIFAPFADPRFSDFTKIHFWKYRRLEVDSIPQARVLAKFDSGDPAVVEIPVGAGRILVLASGWQPEDSQLALSTKFVPLVYSILESSGAPLAVPTLYHVGDTVPLGVEAGEGARWTVTSPAGNQEPIPAGQTNYSNTLAPGIYGLTSGQTSRRFAVNLEATESRTTPFAVEEFERLGVPLASQASALPATEKGKSRLQNSELENRQKLWRWIILFAVGVVLAETWLAGRAARTAGSFAVASNSGSGGAS